jgi:hypothetical protein
MENSKRDSAVSANMLAHLATNVYVWVIRKYVTTISSLLVEMKRNCYTCAEDSTPSNGYRACGSIRLSQVDNSIDFVTRKVMSSLTLLSIKIVTIGITATIPAEVLQFVRLPRTNSVNIPIW